MSKDAHNSTDATPGGGASGGMPAAEQLAVETIARLAAEGYTSSVMKLPRPVLNELGRRLVEPGAKRQAILDWLSEEGGEIPDRNVDRFAQRFREVYKTVWADWANKLIVSQLSSDPAFDHERLQGLIKNRVTTLIAQEVMTCSPAELDTARLNTALSLVFAADRGKLDREKLLLQQAQAESRAMKLEAEVERLRIDNEQRRQAQEQAASKAKQQVDDAASKGDQISREDVYRMIDAVMKGEA